MPFSLSPTLSQRESETVVASLSPSQSECSINYEYFLLAGILCACLPHISFQPLSVIVIATLCMGWRVAFLLKRLPETPKLLQLLVAAAALGLILHGEHYNLGRDSGISLLVAALTIKQIQHQDDLNFYFSVCLTVFVAAAAFLYDHSLFTFLCVGHAVVFVSLALYNKASVKERDTNYRTVARLLFYATPLTLLFFFLAPDFKGPLWGLPNDAYEAQTGLSNEMAPGKISSLIESNEVVFRAKFKHMPENKTSFIESLYWRGPVFAYFDGQTWQSLSDTLSSPSLQKTSFSSAANDDSEIDKTAQPWLQQTAGALAMPKLKYDDNEYRITLEPHYNNWLFTLNTPTDVQDDFYLTEDNELLSRYVVNQPLQYSLKISSIYAGYNTSPDQRYLRMPNLYGRKTIRLVRRLQKGLDPELPLDAQIVTKVLEYFREQPYYYSKKPPLIQYDPVDDFIFKTKTGFCEHYASAFAFMMRAAGIPARVVTGYLGGDYNAVGDYVIVRQSDAHAWAEVWLQNIGWVRVDPTAILPPHRVDNSSTENPYLLAGFTYWDKTAFSRLDDWMDNLSYRWYGFLANVLQTRNQNWMNWLFNHKHYVLVFLLLVLSTQLLWRFMNRDSGSADPVLRAYDGFCHKLDRLGLERLPYESASDYAIRVCEQRPDIGTSVQAITRLYNQLRYGKGPTPMQYRQLCREIAQFRP
ncbi:transglutaminase TgpA family protein [Kaarinaea lacus]